MGNILPSEGDIAGSAEHLRKYAQLDPSSAEAAAVRSYLDDLAKRNAETTATPKVN